MYELLDNVEKNKCDDVQYVSRLYNNLYKSLTEKCKPEFVSYSSEIVENVKDRMIKMRDKLSTQSLSGLSAFNNVRHASLEIVVKDEQNNLGYQIGLK